MAFAEDLAVFFPADGPVAAAAWGASSANVIFNAPAIDVLTGQALGTDFTADMPSAVLPGIARDSVLTIDGVTYTVRTVVPIGDGKIKRLSLYAGT